MFNHAVAGRPPPKHVSTDHDPLFRFHRWLANLRIREIEEVKPASRPNLFRTGAGAEKSRCRQTQIRLGPRSSKRGIEGANRSQMSSGRRPLRCSFKFSPAIDAIRK